MKLPRSVLSVVAASLVSPVFVEAQVIIKDTFAGGDNAASLQGSSPEVNLPRSTYNTTGYFGASPYNRNTTVSHPEDLGSAEMGGSAVLLVSIASSGSYVKPKEIAITAELRIGSLTNDSDDARGVFLGFRSDAAAPQEDPTQAVGYSGLQLAPDGSVYLRNVGDTTKDLKSLGAYNADVLGPLETGDFYRLSYTINTVTGTYSNAVLTRVTGANAGASVRLAQVATSTFTDANTNAAGSYADAHDPNVYGQIDNFVVTGPGKPATARK